MVILLEMVIVVAIVIVLVVAIVVILIVVVIIVITGLGSETDHTWKRGPRKTSLGHLEIIALLGLSTTKTKSSRRGRRPMLLKEALPPIPLEGGYRLIFCWGP